MSVLILPSQSLSGLYDNGIFFNDIRNFLERFPGTRPLSETVFLKHDSYFMITYHYPGYAALIRSIASACSLKIPECF